MLFFNKYSVVRKINIKHHNNGRDFTYLLGKSDLTNVEIENLLNIYLKASITATIRRRRKFTLKGDGEQLGCPLLRAGLE